MSDDHAYMCGTLMKYDPLVESLSIITSDSIEEYCRYYLKDFLQTVHFVTHSKPKEELTVSYIKN